MDFCSFHRHFPLCLSQFISSLTNYILKSYSTPWRFCGLLWGVWGRIQENFHLHIPQMEAVPSLGRDNWISGIRPLILPSSSSRDTLNQGELWYGFHCGLSHWSISVGKRWILVSYLLVNNIISSTQKNLIFVLLNCF